MEVRPVDEIARGLHTYSPETIGAALLGLSDEERKELARGVFPSHEELQTHIDDVSNPHSPNYDPDLAN